MALRSRPGARGNMDKQREYVLRMVEERDIRFIRLWFTDVLGFLKSFAITPAEPEHLPGPARPARLRRRRQDVLRCADHRGRTLRRRPPLGAAPQPGGGG